jgi:hypothetical protein
VVLPGGYSTLTDGDHGDDMLGSVTAEIEI